MLPNGNMISLEIYPKTSVRDVKDKIQRKEGIPPDKQNLNFRGEALEDDQTLENYCIDNDSILQLGLDVKRIFVKMPSEKSLTLEVNPETSIRDVKLEIYEKEEMSPDQQHIFFIGTRLEDHYSLKSYHITTDSVLQLYFVMKISVKMPSGETVTLKVDPRATIRDVKDKIQKKGGILSAQQCLVFGGVELEDDRAMGYYHYAKKSTLRLFPVAEQIFVKMPSGKTITLNVKPETSVRHLKTKIQNKEGIPPDEQHLLFRSVEIEDDRTLKNLQIYNKSTLSLYLAAKQIFVKMPSGKTIPLGVQPETSIRDVKIKIEEIEGIPCDQQHLFFNWTMLSNKYNLWYYNIPNEATLHLRGMQISVVLPTRKKIALDVLPSDSVEILKKKICEKEGIASHQQQLFFDNTQLEDGCSLNDSNIREGSVVFLKPTGTLQSNQVKRTP